MNAISAIANSQARAETVKGQLEVLDLIGFMLKVKPKTIAALKENLQLSYVEK